MNQQEALEKEKIGRLLLRYSIPAILGMVVTSLYNIADRAFIGAIPDVGPMAIAGLGVTMPIFTLIVAFGVLIAMGTVTPLAIKLGEGNKDHAERFLGNAITLAAGISLIVMIVGVVFLDEILILFGASTQTLQYAKDYMGIILLGSLFSILGFVLNAIIRADGNPKMAAKTMIVGCAINLVLDPVFIFGFGLGIKGAAMATVLCQMIVFVWIVSYFLKGKSYVKVKRAYLKLEASLVKQIILVGLAPFFMELSASLVHVLTNRALQTYGGDLSIGAMTVVTSITLMFLMPIFGINQGVQTIIGYNYGAKQFERVRQAVIWAIGSATVVLLLGFGLIQGFPKLFIQLFTKDANLVKLSIEGIRIYLSTLPILGIAIVGPIYFQSIGKVKYAMFLSLMRQLILFVPLLVCLSSVYEIVGVWLAQPVSDVLTAIITLICLRYGLKSLQQKYMNRE